MKKTLLTISFLFLGTFALMAEEYLIVTTVESIVPGGIGRSRMIVQKTPINSSDFTTERIDGKKSDQSSVKRGDAKISHFAETKLLNFYSQVGINFQNIASNDALITDRLNTLAKEGWTLAFVVSGVESDSGKQDRKGIFVTRYVFKK